MGDQLGVPGKQNTGVQNKCRRWNLSLLENNGYNIQNKVSWIFESNPILIMIIIQRIMKFKD